MFDKIASYVRDGNSAKQAQEKIDSAKRTKDAEQAKFDDANNELENAKRNVDKAQADFDAAVSKLQSAQSAVDSACTIQTCEKGKFLTLGAHVQ